MTLHPPFEPGQLLIAEALSAALGPISVPELERILLSVRLSRFAAGTLVRFDAAAELRVVVAGIVAVHDLGGADETKYLPGQLLPSDAHSAPYRALRDVLVAHVPSEALEGWGADRVLRALARTGLRAHSKPPLLVGISGTDPELVAELHRALAAALARFGSVSVGVVERSRGALPSRLELSGLLAPAEFQVVALPSPVRPSDTPEVDRWLYVVDGQRPGEGCAMPRRDAFERPGAVRLSTAVPRATDALGRAPCVLGEPGLMPRTLVVCHSGSRRLPSATRRHLAFHEPDDHRHVRRGDVGHVERLARELAGVPVGFTFGAGGARGLAHLGVLCAAEEAGVPVDYISGTSIGAVIGALVAMGHDADARREAAERLASARPFWDFTLPTTALLRGRRFEALADEFFG
ncbi:MAG TPA: patatin-like phospholipase family protein, partial [Polyangiaceae bacterium]|nr:patatin-like phospholipase family protein [Polyangiaceae bacterium]